jgi:hypothetical protein
LVRPNRKPADPFGGGPTCGEAVLQAILFDGTPHGNATNRDRITLRLSVIPELFKMHEFAGILGIAL